MSWSFPDGTSSKYPVQYESESKGRVCIEKMHDLHLLNSFRKRDHAALFDQVHRCLRAELTARGLDPRFKDGKPIVDCPQCNGTGRVNEDDIEDRCDKCRGTGRAT